MKKIVFVIASIYSCTHAGSLLRERTERRKNHEEIEYMLNDLGVANVHEARKHVKKIPTMSNALKDIADAAQIPYNDNERKLATDIINHMQDVRSQLAQLQAKYDSLQNAYTQQSRRLEQINSVLSTQ